MTTDKLQQQPIAHGLDDTPATGSDFGIDEFGPVRPQCRQRTTLIGAHQPRIADDIGRHDRRQSTFFRCHRLLPAG